MERLDPREGRWQEVSDGREGGGRGPPQKCGGKKVGLVWFSLVWFSLVGFSMV